MSPPTFIVVVTRWRVILNFNIFKYQQWNIAVPFQNSLLRVEQMMNYHQAYGYTFTDICVSFCEIHDCFTLGLSR